MGRTAQEGKAVELSNGQTVVLYRGDKHLYVEGVNESRVKLPRSKADLLLMAEVIQIALQQIAEAAALPAKPRGQKGRKPGTFKGETKPNKPKVSRAQLEASAEAYRAHVRACRRHGAEIMDREAFALDFAGVSEKCTEEEEREAVGRYEPYMRYPQYVSPINWEAA